MDDMDNEASRPATHAPLYLTTNEVAALIRVKERKVYNLAAAGEIPHRRVTGKLLFPRAEIMAWIEGGEEAAGAERPAVLSGSHDPLLDWAVRESGAALATLLNGSLDGLDRFAECAAALTGLHVPDAEGWNIGAVTARGMRGCVLIGWAGRARGLILSDALRGRVASIGGLRGRRVALRQPGSGAAALFDRLLSEAGMASEDVTSAGEVARTESDAAAAVASGEAEATLGLEAMARQFKLPFAPLLQERFDLLVDRRSYFTEPVQRLLAFTREPRFRAKAEAMGGYDLTDIGAVRWLSP